MPSPFDDASTTGNLVPSTATDGQAQRNAAAAYGQLYLWNGASWDRYYANSQLTLLASLARTASPAIATQTNPNHRGVRLYLNVTANASAAGITTRIVELDPVSGASHTLLTASAAVTTTGLFIYSLYPAALADGGTTMINGLLPRSWTATVTHGDASSVTYSLGAVLCW